MSIVDADSLISGLLGILALMNKTDSRLNCSCYANLTLVHSIAIPLRTNCLWISCHSITLLPAVEDVEFESKRLYNPSCLGVLSHFNLFLDGKNNKILWSLSRHGSFDYSSKLERREFHVVFLYCNLLAVVAHGCLSQELCQISF